MPPHVIMQGIPAAIMADIISQQAFIISICAGSVGIILQTMPSLPISIVILHAIMARMPLIAIMPFIMGMGIIPPIMGIGIIDGMPIICGIMLLGIMLPVMDGIMPFIIMGIIPPIMGIGMGIMVISGIAEAVVMGRLLGCCGAGCSVPRGERRLRSSRRSRRSRLALPYDSSTLLECVAGIRSSDADHFSRPGEPGDWTCQPPAS
jgi:hypothetical protein